MGRDVQQPGAGGAAVIDWPSAFQDAPSEAGEAITEAPDQDLQPLISGSGAMLWTYFGAVLVIFLVAFVFLLRSRIHGGGRDHYAPGAPPVEKKAKKGRANRDFFEPAGEDAEITFDDDEAPAPTKRAPAPARSAGHGDLIQIDEEEAEIIIERPAEPGAPRHSAFAGIFARKDQDTEEPEADVQGPPRPQAAALKAHPLASERQRLHEGEPANDLRANESDREEALAEARRAFEEAERERDEQRRRAEEARQRAAERERAAQERLRDEERRLETERAAAEEARRVADREAEFERRKKAAALEQRERELAQWADELADGNDAFRREVANEFDRRFAALSERLEERAQHFASGAATPAPGMEAALSALAGDIDARFDALEEKIEARLVSRSGATSDETVAAVAEMVSRRLADHRESINATLAALSNRMDSFAGAAEEVAGLRRDISLLKRALGERSFGASAPAVQLGDIIRNALPPDAFEMRATLSNNRKADCLIRLPYPPGPIAIDAQFPVEAFEKLRTAPQEERARAENEFRRTALRHVVDIAERLIVPDETAESALMFMPSEAMYATLHERFTDIVQDSYRARVWIVSPTTLMATLHTIRAVMRDAQARESAEIIHTEAQHVLSEVDSLRRRVFKLEEDFSKAHHDVRDVLSTTDQVYRRAESISKSHRTLADEYLDRGSRRIPSPPPEKFEREDDDGDGPQGPAPHGRAPFPLR